MKFSHIFRHTKWEFYKFEAVYYASHYSLVLWFLHNSPETETSNKIVLYKMLIPRAAFFFFGEKCAEITKLFLHYIPHRQKA